MTKDAAITNLSKRGNLSIQILHVNTSNVIKFDAFLTNFFDSFSSTYDDQYFAMHPEPIKKWRSTIRTIQLGWRIPSYDTADAKRNLANISLLAKSLYGEQVQGPDGSFSPKVGGAPLFRVKLLNLMTDSDLAGGAGATSGLLGYIEGFSYNIMLESPFFSEEHDDLMRKRRTNDTSSTRNVGASNIYPQAIEASFNFYPLHEKTPAWVDNEFSMPTFPYGLEESDRFSQDVAGDKNPGSATARRVAAAAARKVGGE